MFVDDIVLCGKSKEEVETKLTAWKNASERKEIKVWRRKTICLCMNNNNNEDDNRGQTQSEELIKMRGLKYLRSTL